MRYAAMLFAGLLAAGARAQGLPPECDFKDVVKGVQQCSVLHPGGCITPLTVTTYANGCTVTMPYDLLCVRTRRREAGSPPPFTPKVRWLLAEGGQVSSNYVFDATTGINMSPPASEFTNPAADGTGVLFSWDTGPNEGSVGHLPVVRPRAGGADCVVVDPLIVNVGN